MTMITIDKIEQFRQDLRRLRESGVSVAKVMEPRLGVHRVQLYNYMRGRDIRHGTPSEALVDRVRPELDQLLQDYGLQ